MEMESKPLTFIVIPTDYFRFSTAFLKNIFGLKMYVRVHFEMCNWLKNFLQKKMNNNKQSLLLD